MPVLDLVDDTYVDVPAAALAALVHDARRWPTWWPDLALEVTRDRGVKGVQWAARPAPGGRPRRAPRVLDALWSGGLQPGAQRPEVAWVGTTEIWLEPWRGRGTVLHHYQRLDPVGPDVPAPRALERLRARRATAWKEHVHRLKDEAESRGAAPAGSPGQVLAATGRSSTG